MSVCTIGNTEQILTGIAPPPPLTSSPLWFDEHAAPRFVPFTPDLVADTYADEAVLLAIVCQNCKTELHVAMSSSYLKRSRSALIPPLAYLIATKAIHYGDPSNMGCCPAEPKMDCIDLRVLEYWQKDCTTEEWERDSSLEIEIERIQQ